MKRAICTGQRTKSNYGVQEVRRKGLNPAQDLLQLHWWRQGCVYEKGAQDRFKRQENQV